MIDYERYDHTYCRVLKDGEEVCNRQQDATSTSNSGISGGSAYNNHIPIQPQMFIEKENGTAPNHEPVIIVRTKRARKTVPIIVKACNTDQEIVCPAQSASSIVAKTKLIHPIIQQVTVENEENSAYIAKDSMADLVNEPSPLSEENASEDTAVEVNPTTKSGRTRKLTAKAQQNSEESKKTPKIQKTAKISVEGKMPKKPRGRPPKAKKQDDLEPDKSIKKDKEGIVKKDKGGIEKKDTKKSGETNKKEDIEHEESDPCTDKKPGIVSEILDSAVPSPHKSPTAGGNASTKQIKSKGNNNSIIKPNISTQKKKGLKAPLATVGAKNSKKKSSVAKPASSVNKSQKPAKGANTSKSKPKSLSTSKRSPKSGRSKLVVITKPPPKRRAQLQEEEANLKPSTAKRRRFNQGQSIPAAKIDTGNIVGSSRRRK